MKHLTPLQKAKLSLKGISLGDAFGEAFFGETDTVSQWISDRYLPEGLHEYTDDTIMSIGVVECLERFGKIERDELAGIFARNYDHDPNRGYGGTAHGILRRIGAGESWRSVAPSVFSGMGSLGNGAAMRAAPIGLYFGFEPQRLYEESYASAEVTHYHVEGKMGAYAVALAAALNAQVYASGLELSPVGFLYRIAKHLPDSDMKSKIQVAAGIANNSPRHAASVLGNGTKLMATDTVPFALWCVARHPRNMEEALWTAVSALGDRDTICAIVGGIVYPVSERTPFTEALENRVEKLPE